MKASQLLRTNFSKFSLMTIGILFFNMSANALSTLSCSAPALWGGLTPHLSGETIYVKGEEKKEVVNYLEEIYDHSEPTGRYKTKTIWRYTFVVNASQEKGTVDCRPGKLDCTREYYFTTEQLFPEGKTFVLNGEKMDYAAQDSWLCKSTNF